MFACANRRPYYELTETTSNGFRHYRRKAQSE